ncbi:MAG: putative signaling protein [Acidobacteria bacterium]|nr:putative signaling protein [Acidobacteriota bacterium]
MIVSCTSCGARYRYDEARFGASDLKRLKCSKCGAVYEVLRPRGPGAGDPDSTGTHPKGKADETTKELELKRSAAAAKLAGLPQLAPLPLDRRYSLAVILGTGTGKIYTVSAPRVIIGRGAGCDIQLQDSEVSRRHAMLEIRGDEATIADLGSTNGTFVESERVQNATVGSHQEFTVGTTTLMFIVTQVSEGG